MKTGVITQQCAKIHLRTLMKIEDFVFGSIRIDDTVYTEDLLIDDGRVLPREKDASRKFRDSFGHTPLSAEEKIPWNCKRLLIGTGVDEKLPVMDEVYAEAKRRGVDLLVLPTAEAIRQYLKEPENTNVILHITC